MLFNVMVGAVNIWNDYYEIISYPVSNYVIRRYYKKLNYKELMLGY